MPIAGTGCSDSPGGKFESYDKLKESQHPDKSQSPTTASQPPSPKNLSGTQETPQNRTSPPTKAIAPSDAPPPTPRKGPAASGIQVASASDKPASNGSTSNTGSSPGGGGAVQAGGATSRPIASAGGSRSTTPVRNVKVLVPSRDFKQEGDDGALRVSYDDIDLLKVLNMEPVTPDAPSLMPAWLKNLDGRRIRIRGFMYPTFQQTGVRAFGLARDNQICCFGKNPKIYDVFDVLLRQGVTTNYIPNRPFDVVGVFHIRPETEDGKLYRLYEMDDATVIAK